MATNGKATESPCDLSAVAQNEEIRDARQTGRTPVPEPWSVEGALKAFGLPIYHTPPTTPIPFFHLLERLKTTRREGWRRFGITHGESISDHMYRMAVLTMLAPASLSKRLDVARCTRMALVHDMAESLVGDITPKDGVSKPEKSRRESTTIDYIATNLLGGYDSQKTNGIGAGIGASLGIGGQDNVSPGEQLRAAWREYEDDETEEAHFVHDIDKLELVLQMVEYEKAHVGRSLDLGEFSWVARRIKMPEMKRWCADLMRERQAFWKAQGREDVPGLENGAQIIAEVEAMDQEAA